MEKPTFPEIGVRHDDDEVTFAVTFKWDRPWAMDHCEVGVLGRQIREALVAKLDGDESMVRELVAVETWEPNEERHIGGRSSLRNVALKPTAYPNYPGDDEPRVTGLPPGPNA